MAKLGKPYEGNWDFGPGGDWEEHAARTKRQLAAIPQDRILRFSVADGSALYFVESLKPAVLRHIPAYDAYRVPPELIRGLRTQDIELRLKQAAALAKLFGQR